MSTLEDAERIARSLPGTCGEYGFAVPKGSKLKGFAWTWKERIHPKQPRVPNLEVLAVRTASVEERDLLIASDPEKFFTEPHYNGFPAVLVRLKNIDPDELAELLTDAWRLFAPRAAGKSGVTLTDG